MSHEMHDIFQRILIAHLNFELKLFVLLLLLLLFTVIRIEKLRVLQQIHVLSVRICFS